MSKLSPASSIQSGSATPNTSQAPTPHGHQHGHSGFGHLLRHMFETPRHASFAVSVTLHELSNVPQLTGSFAVRWKFRGHRPHDADKLLENPQRRNRSLDVKSPGGKSLRGSTSFQSLRTSSSASLAPSGLAVNVPPNAFQRSSSGIVPTRTAAHPVHASTLPACVVSHSAVHGQKPQGYPMAPREGNVVDLAHESDDTASGPPSAPSSRAQSTYSVNSTLSVPVQPNRPRGNSRASTAPVELSLDQASRPSSRAASLRSETSALEPMSAKTTSSQSASILDSWPTPDSTSRKGVTPMHDVRAHSVDWEFQVQHTIRVMLGKPTGSGDKGRTPTGSATNPSGTHTPVNNGKGGPKPIARLGEGPTSDSGLKLEILQAGGKGKENILFGYTNIDLAPFADHGRTARRFLLKDSKTNATIRITVDMKYIGGDQDWAPPPLAEGHLVTGVADLTNEENLAELQLLPTRSYSSDSTHSSVSRPSQRSRTSSVSLTKQPSQGNAVAPPAKHRYKTFEHHLRPEHSAKHRQRTFSGPQGRPPTIDTSSSSSPGRNLPRLIGTHLLTESPISSPILHSSEISPTSTKAPSSYFERSLPGMEDSLYEASGYHGGSRLSPIQTATSISTSSVNAGSILSPTVPNADIHPLSPVDVVPREPAHSPHSGHKHHHHYLGHGRHTSKDLQADLVIEGVFNPTAGEEISPFTYIPRASEETDPVETESSDTSALQLEVTPDLAPAGRWDRIRRRVVSHRKETAVA